MYIILGQITGIIATIITFLSYQTNTKKWLLLTQTSATFCNMLSYIFLGASSGIVLNVVCVVRNIVFFFQKEKTLPCYISAGILSAIMIAVGVYSWQAWYSLLIITALVINTICISLGNAQLLRESVLCSSSLIILYNCFVLSFGGIANEAVAIISSIIGIILFYKEKKASPATAEKQSQPLLEKEINLDNN